MISDLQLVSCLVAFSFECLTITVLVMDPQRVSDFVAVSFVNIYGHSLPIVALLDSQKVSDLQLCLDVFHPPLLHIPQMKIASVYLTYNL